MNRAFVSLYLLIVVSIVGVGWGVDKLWQTFYSETGAQTYVVNLYSLLEAELRQATPAKYESIVRGFGEKAQLKLELLTTDEFANSGLGQEIIQGSIVSVNDDTKAQVSYKRFAETDYVVSIHQLSSGKDGTFFYQALLAFFYLSIALVIYFWVWPLSRDLRHLETQTKSIGIDGVPSKVDIGPHSAIFGLVQSYNRMSERIRELISTHKEMTYAVSHELRTPLARMKFALEMAADIEDKEVRSRKLASIRKDVGEMESLVNELLTYAGFEQGVTKLNLKPGDLGALVKNVVSSCRNEMVTLKHSLVDKIGDEQVFCEWYLIERAIHNLVSNAQRYSTSKVRIILDKDNKDYIVTVEDDGPGVPREDRSRIFNSFVRLRQNTNFEKSGFGLGLSIVNRIMQWHNGRASAHESEWGGARFELRWPQPFKLD
ncbi:two-component system, OmpR family, sensor kinase [Alteromonadaceae bacterium Bs31]|nr:two-component system, OmpR family, sensor kinase [Alteromonadaceae bacterium Bs31]